MLICLFFLCVILILVLKIIEIVETYHVSTHICFWYFLKLGNSNFWIWYHGIIWSVGSCDIFPVKNLIISYGVPILLCKQVESNKKHISILFQVKINAWYPFQTMQLVQSVCSTLRNCCTIHKTRPQSVDLLTGKSTLDLLFDLCVPRSKIDLPRLIDGAPLSSSHVRA
jgi:hypothetical protein